MAGGEGGRNRVVESAAKSESMMRAHRPTHSLPNPCTGSDDEEGDADGGTRLEDEEGIPQDPGNRPSGRKTLPGIDMSSLDDTGGDL